MVASPDDVNPFWGMLYSSGEDDTLLEGTAWEMAFQDQILLKTGISSVSTSTVDYMQMEAQRSSLA